MGATPPWARVKDSGRPDASTIRRSMANSASGSVKSDTTWSTPRPASAMPMAMAVSSSSLAVRVAIGSPALVRWLRVRDVPKPMAPASIASLARAFIRAMSSAVAGSRSAPRWPMTKTRRAAWGSWLPMSTSNDRAARASR